MSRIKEQLAEKGPLAAVAAAVAGAVVAHSGNLPIGLGLLGGSAVLSTLAALSKAALRRLLNDLRFSMIDLSNVPITPTPPRELVDRDAEAIVDDREEVGDFPDTF